MANLAQQNILTTLYQAISQRLGVSLDASNCWLGVPTHYNPAPSGIGANDRNTYIDCIPVGRSGLVGRFRVYYSRQRFDPTQPYLVYRGDETRLYQLLPRLGAILGAYIDQNDVEDFDLPPKMEGEGPLDLRNQIILKSSSLRFTHMAAINGAISSRLAPNLAPSIGATLYERCEGFTLIRGMSNGSLTSADEMVLETNSTACGYEPPPPSYGSLPPLESNWYSWFNEDREEVLL